MTEPMPAMQPKPAMHPSPEANQAPWVNEAPEAERAGRQASDPEEEKPPARPPGTGNGKAGSPPSPPSPDGQTFEDRVSLVARQLGAASRETREAEQRSWLALFGLTAIAIGAVAAGVIAKSPEFWTAVGSVFYLALAVVITYAAGKLGAVSKTAIRLRDTLKGAEAAPDRAEPAQPQEAAPDAASIALELAGQFEEAGQLTEAEHAYLVAAKDGDPEALYWLGQRYIMKREYGEGELKLFEAACKGNKNAAYLLGFIHREHGQAISNDAYSKMAGKAVIAAYIAGRNQTFLAESGLAPYATPPAEVLKNLAWTLPDYAEFWQAYFASLLRDHDPASVAAVIDHALDKHPGNYTLKLLRLRIRPPWEGEGDADSYPESMRPEVHFHEAVYHIREYRGGDDILLRYAISAARNHDEKLPWHAQFLAIEAAHEYGMKHDQEAAELLERALALGAGPVDPVSLGEVKSLAVILKYSGDETARPLISELIRARPSLEKTLSDDRGPVIEVLVSAMVRGIDICAPVPGSPKLSATEITQFISPAEGS